MSTNFELAHLPNSILPHPAKYNFSTSDSFGADLTEGYYINFITRIIKETNMALVDLIPQIHFDRYH